MKSDNPNKIHQELLKKITVKIGAYGSGFFVTPEHILTCYHVIKEELEFDIFGWKEEAFIEMGRAKVLHSFPGNDLALLKLNSNPKQLCGWLDLQYQANDTALIFGFGEEEAQGGNITCYVEGDSLAQDQGYIKLKGGQFQSGYSGSPVLNQTTGKICGIIRYTRDKYTALGERPFP